MSDVLTHPLAEWIDLLSSFELPIFPLHGIVGGYCSCHLGGECDRPGKHPLNRSWQETAQPFPDLGIIPPWANLGIATGGSLVVLDFDDLTLANPADYPPTFTVTTAKGVHLYYRTTDAKRFRTYVRWRPGIDIRAQGGLVVAPPSLHITGIRYLPVDASVPIAPLAKALYSALPEYSPRVVTALPADWVAAEHDAPNYSQIAEYMLADMRTAESGARNSTLYHAAAQMSTYVEIGYLRPMWFAALADAAQEAGLSQAEIARTISSATGGLTSSDGRSTLLPKHHPTPKDSG